MLKNILGRPSNINLNDNIKIKFKRMRDSAVLPSKSHTGDLGFDLHVVTDSHFRYDKIEKKWCYNLSPMSSRLFSVGFSAEIPNGYGILLKDRSGLSSKGLHILGGVVDSGYRGVWNICLINLNIKNTQSYRIYDGDRVCQAVVVPQYNVTWEEVDELSDSDRGISGFGSSGN